jgi:type I restriction-modification system DNA methylase subunit
MNIRKKILKIVRFSNLAKEDETQLSKNIAYVWDDILSKHPSTKNIFLNGKGFDIRNNSTFKNLITKINSIDLKNTAYDILGNAYEEVIQDIMTGKVLGQFFTQPIVKNLMVKLIDPKIHSDGKINTCCDLSMGTGGFLISYLNHVLQDAKNKNIIPDWNFIKKTGIYGKEIEHSTYQLAVSNLLISTGHLFENLDRGDSIREPITQKFDIIMANPPFGIKNLKYDDFEHKIKDKYLPIKTNNAVSLFMQAIIHILNINGTCCVVIPDGQDLFSKTDNKLIAIREYLMRTCDLQKIIYLPNGIFTYTNIKTCIFFFIKKKECDEVIEIKNNLTKQKKTNIHNFKNSTHETKNVKFYEYNDENNTQTLLIDVSIEKIINNSYSLNYMEYMNNTEKKYNKNIIVKTIGEICTFLPKSKKQASYGKKEGQYLFFTSSSICNKYCDAYDYEDECLIIGTGGTANIKHGSKFSCSTDNFVIKINNEYSTKYVYYYLLNNIELLQNGFFGVGLKHISKSYILNIKIPFPSIEHQTKIIEHCDNNIKTILNIKNEIIQLENDMKNLYKDNSDAFNLNEKNNSKISNKKKKSN